MLPIVRSQTYFSICQSNTTRNYGCYTQTKFNFEGQACVSQITALSTGAVFAVASPTDTLEIATFHPSTEAVNGYGVSIRYQASDFQASSTSTSASITSAPIQSTSTSTSTPSSTPAAQSSSGLSIGAKIGIVRTPHPILSAS